MSEGQHSTSKAERYCRIRKSFIVMPTPLGGKLVAATYRHLLGCRNMKQDRDLHRERALIRAFNRVLGLPGMPRIDLSFDAVIARAERSTGLDDWGGADYRERLRFALDSLASSCAHRQEHPGLDRQPRQ